MKKIIMTSSFLLVTVFALAIPPMQQALHDSLSAKIESHLSAPKSDVVEPLRHVQIRQALQAVQERNKFGKRPTMSFNTFLANAHQLEQKNQRAAHIQEQSDAALHQAFFFKGQPRMLYQGSPNYTQDLKDKKYIFIAEASNHDQISLVKHTGHILNALRDANPQAKILLASEFSLVDNEEIIPIRFANTKNENITTYDGYDILVPMADQLRIDILALDDICHHDTPTTRFAKVGPQYIAFDGKDKQILKIANEFGTDTSDLDMVYAYFQYFLASNTYGVELRNQQWLSYIKAVEPFYDIIVVYGGNGHLDISGYRDSVALMLNPQHAAIVSLHSTEKLPEEIQQNYNHRENIQHQFQAERKMLDPIKTFDDGQEDEDLSDDVDWTLDFSKPYFRRYDGNAVSNWRRQHIRNRAAFENYQQQQLEFEQLIGKSPLHFPKWLDLDVYID